MTLGWGLRYRGDTQRAARTGKKGLEGWEGIKTGPLLTGVAGKFQGGGLWLNEFLVGEGIRVEGEKFMAILPKKKVQEGR